MKRDAYNRLKRGSHLPYIKMSLCNVRAHEHASRALTLVGRAIFTHTYFSQLMSKQTESYLHLMIN